MMSNVCYYVTNWCIMAVFKLGDAVTRSQFKLCAQNFAWPKLQVMYYFHNKIWNYWIIYSYVGYIRIIHQSPCWYVVTTSKIGLHYSFLTKNTQLTSRRVGISELKCIHGLFQVWEACNLEVTCFFVPPNPVDFHCENLDVFSLMVMRKLCYFLLKFRKSPSDISLYNYLVNALSTIRINKLILFFWNKITRNFQTIQWQFSAL